MAGVDPQEQVEEVMLELSTLNGKTMKMSVASRSSVSDLKQLLSAELNEIHPGLLRIVGADGDVDGTAPVLALQGQPLTLLFRGRSCVPFHERKVPEQSLVLVDGVPATFDFYSAGGWGSSSKIRFQFNQGERHPVWNGCFQTKDWMTNPAGGTVNTRGRDCLQVLHVLPEESETEENNCETRTWQVIAGTALVRSEMLLESEVICRLPQHEELTVEEGCFLPDADNTPRLRISSPIQGWVTPYLASSNLVLIRPPPRAMERRTEADDPLHKIVQLLAERLNHN